MLNAKKEKKKNQQLSRAGTASSVLKIICEEINIAYDFRVAYRSIYVYRQGGKKDNMDIQIKHLATINIIIIN